jgi:hypothetical protein
LGVRPLGAVAGRRTGPARRRDRRLTDRRQTRPRFQITRRRVWER